MKISFGGRKSFIYILIKIFKTFFRVRVRIMCTDGIHNKIRNMN